MNNYYFIKRNEKSLHIKLVNCTVQVLLEKVKLAETIMKRSAMFT
jgi:hypothetical protein